MANDSLTQDHGKIIQFPIDRCRQRSIDRPLEGIQASGEARIVELPEHVTREARRAQAAREFQAAMAQIAEGMARFDAAMGRIDARRRKAQQ